MMSRSRYLRLRRLDDLAGLAQALAVASTLYLMAWLVVELVPVAEAVDRRAARTAHPGEAPRP
jgi:hypothetical protein